MAENPTPAPGGKFNLKSSFKNIGAWVKKHPVIAGLIVLAVIVVGVLVARSRKSSNQPVSEVVNPSGNPLGEGNNAYPPLAVPPVAPIDSPVNTGIIGNPVSMPGPEPVYNPFPISSPYTIPDSSSLSNPTQDTGTFEVSVDAPRPYVVTSLKRFGGEDNPSTGNIGAGTVAAAPKPYVATSNRRFGGEPNQPTQKVTQSEVGKLYGKAGATVGAPKSYVSTSNKRFGGESNKPTGKAGGSQGRTITRTKTKGSFQWKPAPTPYVKSSKKRFG